MINYSINYLNSGEIMYEEAIEYKDSLYKELSRIGKSLGSDRRLEILDLLIQAPKSVEEISKELKISVANTSRHLQVLRDSHLVKTERDGNRIIYSLSSPLITKLIQLLTDIGENELSEMKVIQHKATTSENVKSISLEQALKSYKNGLLLDVRPQDEYQEGHINSAINIPLDTLSDHLTELPKNRQIIVYCRGRLCGNSNIATQLLNNNGYNALSLNYSYYDWKRALKCINEKK
ncbi:putative HTH-type transcriptional regulator (plasmid) [Lactiplantibacillus plantarum]|jgi:DNA-binding transcriptional ArsR family regulator|nr:Thiosulfate sulfurtransferase GlpE [Lactiplantibacillus plantarum]MCG0656719.1 Arsenical resistance operon repressor [Lactiplantibacillus plantarum]QHM32426.1 putative HTH-type transcriptional regulator [Lactiplantibacillus plantarum]QHM41856.1 putative HTH-type transcriptional regulator [Lactiplantibacillus plantarum]QHM51225.1 putative HTH-type transcriptional regulator [Lactiplantibacillus plantarum]